MLGTVTTSPYSYTWSTVANGSYSLTVVATDNNNVATTSSAIAITVSSNTPPTCSITAPTNGTTYTAPASVTITASAAGTGGATISSVKFYYASTTLLATVTTSPYTYSWTSVAAGSYALTAQATDNHSLTTTSSAVAMSWSTPRRRSASPPRPTTPSSRPRPAASPSPPRRRRAQWGYHQQRGVLPGRHAAQHGLHLAVHLQLDERGRRQLLADRQGHRQQQRGHHLQRGRHHGGHRADLSASPRRRTAPPTPPRPASASARRPRRAAGTPSAAWPSTGQHAPRHRHHLAVQLHLDQRGGQRLCADRGRHRQYRRANHLQRQPPRPPSASRDGHASSGHTISSVAFYAGATLLNTHHLAVQL